MNSSTKAAIHKVTGGIKKGTKSPVAKVARHNHLHAVGALVASKTNNQNRGRDASHLAKRAAKGMYRKMVAHKEVGPGQKKDLLLPVKPNARPLTGLNGTKKSSKNPMA
jgi:hypothetical protein